MFVQYDKKKHLGTAIQGHSLCFFRGQQVVLLVKEVTFLALEKWIKFQKQNIKLCHGLLDGSAIHFGAFLNQ